MATLDEIGQEKQKLSDRLARIDAERAKVADQLNELEVAERCLPVSAARRPPETPTRSAGANCQRRLLPNAADPGAHRRRLRCRGRRHSAGSAGVYGGRRKRVLIISREFG